MGRMTPIREAFCRALELPQAERRAFLVELAPEMREEVVSLIAAHESKEQSVFLYHES